ncbi:Serine/threonine-protein phosphatase [Balamuthia mandrillaris]
MKQRSSSGTRGAGSLAAPPTTTSKEQAAAAAEASPASSSSSWTTEDRAAVLIQRRWRGMRTRRTWTKLVWQQVWNILDNDDEKQSIKDFQKYKQLEAFLQQTKLGLLRASSQQSPQLQEKTTTTTATSEEEQEAATTKKQKQPKEKEKKKKESPKKHPKRQESEEQEESETTTATKKQSGGAKHHQQPQPSRSALWWLPKRHSPRTVVPSSADKQEEHHVTKKEEGGETERKAEEGDQGHQRHHHHRHEHQHHHYHHGATKTEQHSEKKKKKHREEENSGEERKTKLRFEGSESLLEAKKSKKIKEAEDSVLVRKQTKIKKAASAPPTTSVTSNKPFSIYLEKDKPLTQGMTESLLSHFKKGQLLERSCAREIIRRFKKALIEEDAAYQGSAMRELRIPQGARLTVLGDTHGQLDDLLTVFRLNGVPSPMNIYLVNGDFVDRGDYGFEICMLLFSFKLYCPQCIYLNRGNHEASHMNAKYSFEAEVLRKYDRKMLDKVQEVFKYLPLATLIHDRVLVLHGGLFSSNDISLDHIRSIDYKRQAPRKVQSFNDQLFSEILWSDPRPITGTAPSQRGAGIYFGQDVTQQFLERNGLSLIIRSHEMVAEGFQLMHGRQIITLFSASNYCGANENFGAFITFGEESYDDENMKDSLSKNSGSLIIRQHVSYSSTTTSTPTVSLSSNANEASKKAQTDNSESKDEGKGAGKLGEKRDFPSLIPVFHRFQADPIFGNLTMHTLDMDELQTDILQKLRERIFENRELLLDYFSKFQDSNQARESNKEKKANKSTKSTTTPTTKASEESTPSKPKKASSPSSSPAASKKKQQQSKESEGNKKDETKDVDNEKNHTKEKDRETTTTKSKKKAKKLAANKKVTKLQWAQAMDEVLNLPSMPWLLLRPYLAVCEKDGTIDWHKFLSRYQIQLNRRLVERWVDLITEEVCQKIYSLDFPNNTLEWVFEEHDVTQDEILDFNEFMAAMQTLGLDLSETQLRDFVRSIDPARNDHAVSKQAFITHFLPDLTALQEADEKWIREAMSAIGTLIYKKATKDATKGADTSSTSPTTASPRLSNRKEGEQTLKQMFRQFDLNKDGRISYHEFSSALRKLGLSNKNPAVAYQYGKKERTKLALHFDKNRSGYINYKEFMKAFQVDDLCSSTERLKSLKQEREKERKEREKKEKELSAMPATTETETEKLPTSDATTAISSTSTQEQAPATSSTDVGSSKQGVRAPATSSAPSATDPDWKTDIIHRLSRMFWQNRYSIERAWRLFDNDGSGFIDAKEWEVGLTALNEALAATEDDPSSSLVKLSPKQMAELFAVVDIKKTGKVDYEEFLDTFRVVDTSSSSPVKEEEGGGRKGIGGAKKGSGRTLSYVIQSAE